MEFISIDEIIEWSGGELVSGNNEGYVSSVCADSRTAEKGCLFVPIKGNNVDGHIFISEVLKNGASASLCNRSHIISNCNGTIIAVEDTLKALQSIAQNYRYRFNIPIIGVTGSVGKSTTKEMISVVLESNFDVLKTENNYNGQIGVPLTLLKLESRYNAAVIEMGISEFGEMDKLSEMVDPSIGAVTNIGISHIENFKTEENIREEKLKLIKDYNGKYYLNGDSPLLSDINRDKFKDVTYFGLNGSYPYSAVDISSDGESTEFVLVTPEFRENIVVPCLGIHNVYNALAAISIAIDMGIHLDDIKNGFSNYKGISMRQQILKIGNITLIDDSYNSSPDSLKSSISVLRSLKPLGKNIAVIADMLELGEKSSNIHYEIGKYIAIEGIDLLITIGPLSSFMESGAKDSGRPIEVVHCEDNKEAYERLISVITKGDKILVKGSRGMHTDEIVSLLKDRIKNSQDWNT